MGGSTAARTKSTKTIVNLFDAPSQVARKTTTQIVSIVAPNSPQTTYPTHPTYHDIAALRRIRLKQTGDQANNVPSKRCATTDLATISAPNQTSPDNPLRSRPPTSLTAAETSRESPRRQHLLTIHTGGIDCCVHILFFVRPGRLFFPSTLARPRETPPQPRPRTNLPHHHNVAKNIAKAKTSQHLTKTTQDVARAPPNCHLA